MTVTCAICQRESEPENCQAIELSPAEKAVVGPEAPSLFHYCLGCWNLMKSQHAPNFMATQVERYLRDAGIRDAKKIANSYREKLESLKK